MSVGQPPEWRLPPTGQEAAGFTGKKQVDQEELESREAENVGGKQSGEKNLK